MVRSIGTVVKVVTARAEEGNSQQHHRNSSSFSGRRFRRRSVQVSDSGKSDGNAYYCRVNTRGGEEGHYKKGRPEGGKPKEDQLKRKDTAKVKSEEFKEFLEEQGGTP